MGSIRLVRAAGVVAVCVALVAGSAASAAPRRPHKPGPNLVLNAGFEDSAFEGNAVAPPGSLAQPLLPTAWTVEGLTVLFDHTPNSYRSGKRGAGISGSLSGPDRTCPAPPTCVDNPTKAAKAQLASTYTLAPHWRTSAPIPVTANTDFVFSAWVRWVIVTVGEGASMKVRWTGGSAVSESILLKRSTVENNNDLPFTKMTFKVKSPAGATGAVLMLGQTDDAWTGQVVYDDVHFGTPGK